MNHIKLGEENCAFLQMLQIPHVVKTTNSTVRIEIPGAKPMLFSDGFIPMKYLAFIKKVKTCVQKSEAFHENKEYIKRLTSQDVKYILDNSGKSGYFEDCAELDINGAYWVCAYQLGYITKDVYLEGVAVKKDGRLKIPKMVRLIALGALARKRTVREYDTGKKAYEYKGLEYDSELGGVFFHVAKRVGDIMLQCVEEMGQSAFLLFWVDAFIVEASACRIVEHFMKVAGYEVKRKHLHYLNITDAGKGRRATTHVVGEEKPKYFQLSADPSDMLGFQEFLRRVGR